MHTATKSLCVVLLEISKLIDYCTRDHTHYYHHYRHHPQSQQQEEEERKAIKHSQSLSEQAHMGYIADYLLHRITMPDQNGNLLQPDVTQPGVEVISSIIWLCRDI